MWYLKLAGMILTRSDWRKMLTKSETKAFGLARSKTGKKTTIDGRKNQIPISTKQTVFENKNLGNLVGDKLKEVKFVMMSSGSSTKFSLGVFTQKEMKLAAKNTDLFMSLFFGAQKNKTLIINTSSMGVRVFSNFVVSDTGPRIDIVIGLLKTVAVHYSTVFIIGDPIFIKLMVEEAIANGVDWTKYRVFFISGGEWLSESLRNYVHKLTGKSGLYPKDGCWVGTYGITEIGYPLFFENPELVAYREKHKVDFSKPDSTHNLPRVATPFYFFFRANSFYLENYSIDQGVPRMVFTPLNKNRMIPIYRYDTGDVGEVLQYNLGLKQQPMPVVKFWGRDKNYFEMNGQKIFLLDIKEMFFSIHELLPQVTGFFTINQKHEKLEVMLQCKKQVDANTLKLFELQCLFDQVYPELLNAVCCNYYEMQQQMELDFERKFQHLN